MLRTIVIAWVILSGMCLLAVGTYDVWSTHEDMSEKLWGTWLFWGFFGPAGLCAYIYLRSED